MNVILLTAFIGLVLAALFVALFLYQMECKKFSSNDRESLMPLQAERTRPAHFEKAHHGKDDTERS